MTVGALSGNSTAIKPEAGVTASIPYRGEIDGLRAVAVFLVIFYHAGFSAFGGGYVGVDVFFVISGYLITSIILREKALGSFTLVGFYERRIRRILPALYVVSATCILLAWFLMPPGDLREFARSLVATAFSISNFHFWKEGGYFEVAGEVKPLLHTWSLAVEEQYYLIFPLLLLAAWRLGKVRILVLLAVTALLSLALAQWGAYNSPKATFFLLPARGWELAIGAMLAFPQVQAVGNRVGRVQREILAGAGAALIIASALVVFGKDTPHPSVYALLPTVGAGLVLLFGTSATAVGSILKLPAIVALGLISYSAYLWHQPLFAFARIRYDALSDAGSFALIIVVLLLSGVTWFFVERPARDPRRFSRRSAFSLAILGTATFAAIGSTLVAAFDRSEGVGQEKRMAAALLEFPAVIITNVNEREFVMKRIELETLAPKAIVVGSSRAMQIDVKTLGLSSLNLSVSGASLEDIVAITGAATKKFRPQTLVIGLDPWLFNDMSGQTRWRSIAAEYERARNEIAPAGPLRPQDDRGRTAVKRRNPVLATVSTLYSYTNRCQYGTRNDAPALFKMKVRRDGSYVYPLEYADTAISEGEAGSRRFMDYAMSSYSYSRGRHEEFKIFLKHYAANHKVRLVLSPYHPAHYDILQRERAIYVTVEEQFRELANELGVPIVGSYDPSRSKCNSFEFFDAMHPTNSCMAKVLARHDAGN